MSDTSNNKPATWAKRLPCPCGAGRDALAMMCYDGGWYRIECHAGGGCDNFGASGFRKDAVELWNDHVRSGANYRLPTSAEITDRPATAPSEGTPDA